MPSRADRRFKEVHRSNFVEHLKGLDFRTPTWKDDWKNVTWQFESYQLWGGRVFGYRLRRRVHKEMAERFKRRYGDHSIRKDVFKSCNILRYSQDIIQLDLRVRRPRVRRPKETSTLLIKYVLYFGDLFIKHIKAREVCSS